MIFHHYIPDIVREHQAEAERVAAVHRSTRDLRAGSSLRSRLARALVRAGEHLDPTPASSTLPRPTVHLVTGWYSRTYRTSPSC